MNEYAIQTTNLTKSFGVQCGVDQINLHVPKGKIYGLLGRNGAGKTTTMRMLLGLARPTSGKITLFGKDYRQNPRATYHRIGSMIETPGFYENLTAEENLRILTKLRGYHNEKSVNNALSIVGLENEEKKTFGNYSLGMKQRLGIAAAIIHEPELLILDEPINGLDPVGISVVRRYLEMLCKERGTTILISSHILSEIENLADIIGVMNVGKLIEEVAMSDLHKRNRRYVEFGVSDVNKACLLLEEKYKLMDYTVHEHECIRIYSDLGLRAQLNKTFVEYGIEVYKMNMSKEKLEEYFAQLTGGNQNDSAFKL